jgi:hypothetical protein
MLPVDDFEMTYPNNKRIEKFIKRNHKINHLLLFLPDRLPENLISINQAKTRNGNPKRMAIFEILVRISGEITSDRNILITTCPHIP